MGRPVSEIHSAYIPLKQLQGFCFDLLMMDDAERASTLASCIRAIANEVYGLNAYIDDWLEIAKTKKHENAERMRAKRDKEKEKNGKQHGTDGHAGTDAGGNDPTGGSGGDRGPEGEATGAGYGEQTPTGSGGADQAPCDGEVVDAAGNGGILGADAGAFGRVPVGGTGGSPCADAGGRDGPEVQARPIGRAGRSKRVLKPASQWPTEADFVASVRAAALGKYSEELVDSFINYWAEKNSNGKMRCELKDCFEIGRRLVTWATRNREMTQSVQRFPTRNERLEKGIRETQEYIDQCRRENGQGVGS